MPLRLWFYARALLSGVALTATIVTGFSQPFTVTVEAPAVQQSSLATNPMGFGVGFVPPKQGSRTRGLSWAGTESIPGDSGLGSKPSGNRSSASDLGPRQQGMAAVLE